MSIRNKIRQLTPELSLYRYHQIPMLEITHAVGCAQIALQGAQLLSWKPHNQNQDVFWLSAVEPFISGNLIRGGVPLCYPWFGTAKSPIHGTARLRLWELSEYQLQAQKVRLTFSLFDDNQQLEAAITMIFSERCEIIFTHYGQQPAQVALHSYFHIGNIAHIDITGLTTPCFNAVSRQMENSPSIRRITASTDCIYTDNIGTNRIIDYHFNREIAITHHNATEIVLWNPWHTPMSAMQAQDYQNMICLETARLSQPLMTGEQISVSIIAK
ncbi:D-hexose-6-phosphate mutarotase [Testudinibacter aquarius]|uniref:Putative glucose-6-phosphate 1-epimerase n=1 Tax=Testudinibacter aquarius TaxID=1524974 RepID=A0A4R3YCX9_9PAST|nr:D-hexose-6-phosphate mutarotase [Testudinibacter aquarius]KAE9529309.1 D-hexose-6-phosphate mutarotase [Testudinibacter aquarius]TCV89721.1 glucose-6-phosphate 1-epimerase [Testudinibacter aquarius]TNG88926.1 D-hexose-6-phosphate mutarotase [Testudinibacter aquarius]